MNIEVKILAIRPMTNKRNESWTGNFNIRKLGVIANPAAGKGRIFIQETTRKILEFFKDSQVIRPHLDRIREATVIAANNLSQSVDAILVVGGDGTMSDVAYGLFKSGADTPILGIGAGSTNAGPLFTVKAWELNRLDPFALKVQVIGGILAGINGKPIGIGFNDIVLGDTILTSIRGHVVQVSAAEFMKGKKIPAPPQIAGTNDSEVSILHKGKTMEKTYSVHKGMFGQFFAAPLEKRYLGKGLAGGTSLAAALGLPAGISIINEPLINYSIGIEEFLEKEPIITKTASFRENDEVIIMGLRDGTCLNIDGNPLVILRKADEVRLRYISSATRVLKLKEE